jgi:hypothetical protein
VENVMKEKLISFAKTHWKKIAIGVFIVLLGAVYIKGCISGMGIAHEA